MTTFESFLKPPPEIRYSIWKKSFEARVIVTGLTFSGTDGFAKVSIPPQPPLLWACRESRQIMLSCGYKRWKLAAGRWRAAKTYTSMIWNPAIDIVYVYIENAPSTIHLDQVFTFMGDIREATRLALPTSFLARQSVAARRIQFKTCLDSPFIRELIFVVDSRYERDCIQYAKELFERTKEATRPWSILRDIESMLSTNEAYSGTNCIISIRIACNEKDILSGECKELILRGFPCRDFLEIC